MGEVKFRRASWIYEMAERVERKRKGEYKKKGDVMEKKRKRKRN
jgi:hypothetical protein